MWKLNKLTLSASAAGVSISPIPRASLPSLKKLQTLISRRCRSRPCQDRPCQQIRFDKKAAVAEPTGLRRPDSCKRSCLMLHSVSSKMPTPPIDEPFRPLPRNVAIIGAAGGLGQGVLNVCRAEGVGFTAIVRSRPERIADVPDGSRVAVVASLADRTALAEAFSGADAVLAVLGTTSTSYDSSALLSANAFARTDHILCFCFLRPFGWRPAECERIGE